MIPILQAFFFISVLIASIARRKSLVATNGAINMPVNSFIVRFLESFSPSKNPGISLFFVYFESFLPKRQSVTMFAAVQTTPATICFVLFRAAFVSSTKLSALSSIFSNAVNTYFWNIFASSSCCGEISTSFRAFWSFNSSSSLFFLNS